MLFSSPAFAFKSIGCPKSDSSELFLTASGIQYRIPRRTVFPAIRSSLLNALCGRTRFHHGQLCRLHDTRLQPTHNAMGFAPVNGVPVHIRVGNRTSLRFLRCHVLCFLDQFGKFSREKRPDGSQPPFGVRQSLNLYLVCYRRAFAFSIIMRPAIPSACLAACFPPKRETTGLPRSTHPIRKPKVLPLRR